MSAQREAAEQFLLRETLARGPVLSVHLLHAAGRCGIRATR